MTDDPRHQAVLAVLTENGVTAPETDLDTLASRVLAAADAVPAASSGTDATPDAGDNADHTATP